MSGSESDDDLITYGTALEPLEEDEIPCKKPRLLEDQIVTDKQGRRRFHGAFTGGFSAGFYNTVGSLEGWTPSLFKSSKSKKQESITQKPEDFMDEEDLSEFGIAPMVLKARQDYTNEKSKSSSKHYGSQVLGSYVLEGLLKPVKETVGVKLLKKMGWKPGQGVGPRLNKKEKKVSLKMQQKIYGCQLPPGSTEEQEEDSDSDSEWDAIEFAPSDYEPILCEARNNFCGLGYQGLDKRLILSAGAPGKKEYNHLQQNRKLAFGSQAFGVGAFEEEDEDIYAREDMSRYDFSLGNDQAKDANKTPDKKQSASEGVIEGFIFECTKRVRKNYPLPTLPKDFKARHRIRVSRFDDPSPNDKKVPKGLQINSETRKTLLQDHSDDSAAKEMKRQNEALTKELIANVKISISSTFKPFSSNPEKQERYENYLKLSKIGKKERLSDLQPFSMTSWDKEREKVEFEKAAALFKPLSGEMGDRFLTASQPDDLSDPLAVVEKFQDDKDDARKAAKMNMFGPLTRKTEDWTPCQILCKRFNIPEPTGRAVSERKVEKKTEKSYFNLFANIETPKANEKEVENKEEVEDPIQEESKEPNLEKSEPSVKNLNEVSDKADLFKAIFLASDDESDDEKGGGAEDDNEHKRSISQTEEIQTLLFEERLINSKRNTSPPKGIFENIDFDLLSTKTNKTNLESTKSNNSSAQPEQSEKKTESREPLETNAAPEELVYGPKIPEKTSGKVVVPANKNLTDNGIWVEKKTKKHKKKEKKNKKSYHKVKHKHKKHKR